MSVTTMLQVLEAEAILFREMVRLEQQMLAALLDHDSAATMALQEEYRSLGSHVDRAESIRTGLLQELARALGIDPARMDSTSHLVVRILGALDPDNAARFREGMKDLQSAMEELRMSNRALSLYTRARLDTLDCFLAELLPERGNGLYGSDGRQQSNLRPQILNRSM